jgi:YfiH family protein
MIEIPELRLPGIRHGFFGREGGHSSGIFASLNCGLGSGDARDAVLRNRAVVAAALGGGETDIVTAHQVHSADAMIVTERVSHEARPKLDGLVTNVPGIILGSLTADCAPVLFADAEARVIGAAHAGWKGALAGVTDATIAKMEILGARRERMAAVIGPTISKANYEVGPEFRERFPEEAQKFFIDSVKQGHYMFDLPGYLLERMRRSGVALVINTGLCTYADERRFYSYRRAAHRNETDYGRQIAAICLS